MLLLGLAVPKEVVALGGLSGLLYGLLGVGIALSYRTSRVLNFAHGQTGTLAAALVPFLVFSHGVPVLPAMVLAVVAGLATGALIERFVVFRLVRASRLLVLVATLGLAQLLLVFEGLIPRHDLAGKTYPTLLHGVHVVAGIHLSGGALQALIAAPIATVALELFLRRTRLGLATRAAAENDEVASLAGVPVRIVTLVAWAIAGGLAATAAILSGPSRPVITTVAAGPTLMVRGLLAALLVGFGSLPLILLAGVGIGALEALVIWNAPSGGGVLELVMLGLVLVTILMRKDLRASVRGTEETSFSLTASVAALPDALARHPVVVRARRGVVAAVVAVAVLWPLVLDNADRLRFTAAALVGLVGLSLVMLTGFAGQISLGQYAFVAVGAVVGGRLQSLGYPWLSGLVYVAIAGALLALIVGVPALRIRGVYLAITTLAFGVAMNSWIYQQNWLVRGPGGTSALHGARPALWGVSFGSQLAYCWLCLAIVGGVGAALLHLRRTGFGRALVAVRDNEASAAALTISPTLVKLTAFALSGALACIAGYLYGGLIGDFTVHPETSFAPELSLAVVGVVVFGGVVSVPGVLAAAFAFAAMNRYLQPLLATSLSTQLYAILTASALLGTVLNFPSGLAGFAARLRDRLVAGFVPEPGELARPQTVARSWSAPVREEEDAEPVRAEGIVMRYGGRVALDHVDLVVARGSTVALVGPNGAGKTTLFDVLTGRITPDEGRVVLNGHDVTGLQPHERARLGVGRTFQQARLFPDLTLRETLCVAQEDTERSELVPSLLGLPPSRRVERVRRARAEELLERFGLHAFADRRVAELSTGTRRLAELATQVALGAPVLLLDEPTAGVAQREVEAFAPVLRQLRDDLDASVVIIDHDVPLLRAVADRMVVLEAGVVVADCAPDDLERDPKVIAAFLGTSEAAIKRSGKVRVRA